MSYDDRPGFSPWDDRRLPNIIPADEEARRVAAFIWIERRLAEVLRNAAKSAPGPVAGSLERQAGHHEWHATVWLEHLATSPDAQPAGEAKAGPSGDAGAPPAGCEHLTELFDTVGGAGDVLESLAGLSRVVSARLIAAYTFHRSATGTDLGPDATRWLDIVLDDEHDARNELELYLQSLISTPEDAERLGRWQARLEAPLVRVGGLIGQGTLGGEALPATSTITPLRGTR